MPRRSAANHAVHVGKKNRRRSSQHRRQRLLIPPAARASWPAATGSSGQDARASGAVPLVADGRPPVGVDGPRMPPAGQRRGATDTGRRRGGERRRRAGRARLAGTAGSSSTGPAADGERWRRMPPAQPKRRAAAPASSPAVGGEQRPASHACLRDGRGRGVATVRAIW